jgi:uncharacterized membrane protein
MSFAPLLAAPAMVQLHAGAAIAALLLGSVQMLASKGTLPHRLVGWTWVVLMVVVAVSSLGIMSFRPVLGTFGWIHILSAVTLVSLPVAVLHARRGRITNHRHAMTGLFLGALVISGALTLLPGRIMNKVVFDDPVRAAVAASP